MSAAIADGASTTDELELIDTPPTATWLAAYAMGLVSSEEHMDAVAELRSCLRGGDEAVGDAMTRLDDPATGDVELRVRARSLLAAAADMGSVSTAGAQTRDVRPSPLA